MGVSPNITHLKRHRHKYLLAMLVVIALVAFIVRSTQPRPAVGATAQASFTVAMTILPTCTLATNPLAFPAYSGAVDTATATMTVNCTNMTTYNVGLGPGTKSGATVTTRQVASGTNYLNYGLFSNNTYTTNWGQTVGTDTVAGTGTGAAQTLTVYGRVPAGQIGAPATYTDTIVATVTY